jgi:hypothetical protein
LADVGDIFQRLYEFTVAQFPIPLKNSQAVIEQEFQRYERYLANPDCPFILYYVGHGTLALNMRLRLYHDK